jgi:uncharacterized flavoprotein (TIGR03862 family)
MTDLDRPASPTVAVIGAGPAGLMAAETLAAGGARVTVFDQMPSVGRKLLMAGRGGLNLTHSEPLDAFITRYGEAADWVGPLVNAFDPASLTAWAESLGQPTFIGSSGRVFPKAMKASPLLRAWLGRLDAAGVTIRTRARFTGWDGGALVIAGAEGEARLTFDAVVLAMGGASWPRLGSDGAWTALLPSGAVAPLRPANAGFDVAWSEMFRDRFAGQPLKGVTLTHEDRTIAGEAMIAAYGVEGGGVYALSAGLREAIERDGFATLTVDLRPDLTIETLAERLAKPGRPGDSGANRLRKSAGLSPVAVGLLREIGPFPPGHDKLARRIKGVRLKLSAMQGLDRAISSAGGVKRAALDDRLMLADRPGIFVAGEMLDWEAPTGGYLLQACFASGVAAARGALAWLEARQAAA